MSTLASFLKQRKFCFSIEYVEYGKSQPKFPTTLAGYPTCLAIADRVHSDQDRTPLQISQSAELQNVLLHYSGKNRDISELEQFLNQTAEQQKFEILMLSGDKLKNHHSGQKHPTQRTRYLESINSIMYAKQKDSRFYIGAAFNPFKYTESEKEAQYLKLHKKIQVGADFLITQLGFDLDQLRYLKSFLTQNYIHIPVMVCVMPLTYSRAKYIVEQRVAGIVVSPYLLQYLKHEHSHNPKKAERNAYSRAALHILICKYLGFVGIHLSCCHQPEQIKKLEWALQKYQHFTLMQCWQEYMLLLNVTDMQALHPSSLTSKMQQASVSQMFKYYSLSWIHNVFFDSKLAKRLGHQIFNLSIWQYKFANRSLLMVEHTSKKLTVGCESCGECRLESTLYICPETCPKGLANGPCGGTFLDRCEFNDRECIHSKKYRVAKQAQKIDVLKQQLIPTIPLSSRQHSSWIKWFKNSHSQHKNH